MEKRQAKDYIREVLNQSFDSERFELFIRNLLNDIEQRGNSYSGNLIPEAFRDHIAHYKRIGKYTDPEGEELDVLIIQTRSVKKLERTRTALRNFVVRHLKTFEKQYALAAFYSKEDEGAEWRFSLVKIDYETKKGKKGKIKVEEELVPAKRFSFLVGKYEDAHTAQKQLLPILTNDHANPLIIKEKDGDGSIEGAFSIQKVTDEFYEQYKELYLKLAENKSLTQALKEENLDIERFVKKLLGQIVFLYFLQKKGWLGVPKDQKMGEGSKRFLQKRYDLAQKNGENYYNDFLRYLFYEALAKEHNDEGVIYYFKKLGCRIPFLNGGLFEANFEWKHTDFTISNDLFRNEEKNKAGDKGTGILDVFDRYNFTIKEDEPLEKEVAVDPEMLGKVFENMLDIKERKSKGAYYTPREIVHYMCQESLIHYLDNTINDYTASYQLLGSDQGSMFEGSSDKKGNLNLEIENKGEIRVPKESLEEFIRKGHLALEHEAIVQSKGKETVSYKFKLPESIRKHAEDLDKSLAGIKICDTAIGSGAFPVGLLHEIVTARQVLNSFLQREGYSSYNLKRHAIQESIYGVDIDASAIDIARLRLWLSMIVDEEDYDSIDALPNLDYKIICGNSLVGLPDSAMRNLEIEKELEILKEDFFDETDEEEKKSLRNEINSKIRQLLDSAEEFAGYDIDFDFKLLFSEVWEKKAGFDVVIGNPPYGAKLEDEEKDLLKNRFSNIVQRIRNSFLYFIGVSEGLINKRGNVTLIVPNEFLFQVYMSKARAHYLKNNRMLKAINVGENAFDAIVPTCVIMYDKRLTNNDYKFDIWDFRNKTLGEIESILQSGDLKKTNSKFILNIPNHTYSFNPEAAAIVNRITKSSTRFEKYCEDIANGISTSHNKVYIVSKEKVNQQEFEEEYTKPTIKGKDIRKFHVPEKPSRYVLYVDKSFELDKYPKIKQYLELNKDELISKSVEKRKGKRPWYILFRARYEGLFVSPKIVFRQTADSIICAVDRVGYYSIDSTNIAQVKSEQKVNVGAFSAILNSEIVNFYYRQISQEGGRVLAQVKPTRIRSLPIPEDFENYTGILNKLENYLKFLTKLQKDDLLKSFFMELNNGVAYELFFPESVSSVQKNIIASLSDLPDIYMDKSVEENHSIIKNVFEKLYDPNHPVRNNLETLDSIEEVRVIKETLKNN